MPLSRYCWPQAQPLRSGVASANHATRRTPFATASGASLNTGSLSKKTSSSLSSRRASGWGGPTAPGGPRHGGCAERDKGAARLHELLHLRQRLRRHLTLTTGEFLGDRLRREVGA